MKTIYTPRKLARKIAKANMKKAGIRKPNKQMKVNWRKWVFCEWDPKIGN